MEAARKRTWKLRWGGRVRTTPCRPLTSQIHRLSVHPVEVGLDFTDWRGAAAMASSVPAGGRAAAIGEKGTSVNPQGEVEGEAVMDLLQGRSLAGEVEGEVTVDLLQGWSLAGATTCFCCP